MINNGVLMHVANETIEGRDLRFRSSEYTDSTFRPHVQLDCCVWGGWLDRDNPDALGDYETTADFNIAQIGCSTPIAIECATTAGAPYTSTGETFVAGKNCDLAGLACKNSDNPPNGCSDYKVKYCVDDLRSGTFYI
eukprot:TRINITY_DN4136_c0_g1_i1.p1 TRINITY_DN4136_c0_g1~~TRINITY_DN4136_c0_g1_i1.p1  ORF type:complete len:137 (-),score=11.52 TRINITY_DN4136_c0_g1_i1:152-562(-)